MIWRARFAAYKTKEYFDPAFSSRASIGGLVIPSKAWLVINAPLLDEPTSEGLKIPVLRLIDPLGDLSAHDQTQQRPKVPLLP